MSTSARQPIVGGNWKLNTTLPTARDLAREIADLLGDASSGAKVVLCPPFPNLEAVHQVIQGSRLQLGAQDAYWEDSGAFTGEVSCPMLKAVGCDWVIVGHSERRRLFGESNEIVNRKLRAVLAAGLRAILAIGETREERVAGDAESVCQGQLGESLTGIDEGEMGRVVVAYEPVWAIGTGETASPLQAQEAHLFVRRMLSEMYGDGVAASTRIQYGGSVTASNAAELMSQADIDGALVGGASLKPNDFAEIVKAAATA